MTKQVYSTNLDIEAYALPVRLQKIMALAHDCMKHVRSAHYTQCVRLYKKDYDELDALVRKQSGGRYDLTQMRFHGAKVVRV